jgi:hypothetical protein
MNRLPKRHAALALLALAALVAPARAADLTAGATPEAHRIAARAAADSIAAARTAASPLVREIRAVLDETSARVQALGQQATAEPARRLAIQREIQSVKLAAERRVIGIQLEHVRRAGNAEAARELEAALKRLEPADRSGAAPPR